jgi:type III pantothenate kinase
MKLLIDVGNSYIKWAIANNDAWLHSGVFPLKQASKLPRFFAGYPDIKQIWVSNVAGEAVAQQIRNIRATQSRPHFIVARQEQCGVRNNYANVNQLGSDRWAALIAAWHLVRGECLVVNSGTATTIDALSGQGKFLGGLIVPGVELMQRSLIDATNQLKSERAKIGLLKSGRGKYVPFPRNTADAVFSGALQASCGAIERQYALLGDDTSPVVLSGGAAGILRGNLNKPLRVVDNLTLLGLLLIAREAGE